MFMKQSIQCVWWLQAFSKKFFYNLIQYNIFLKQLTLFVTSKSWNSDRVPFTCVFVMMLFFFLFVSKFKVIENLMYDSTTWKSVQ